MVTATLSRGSTSVTFELWEEGGNLLVARDVGKPEGGATTVSRTLPRTSDNLSAIDQFTIVGRLDGSNAHADALTLAEELVRAPAAGSDLSLDLSNVTGYSSYTVGVPDARSLELDYRPGVTDVVDLQMLLPNVNSTISSGSASPSSSTTAGSGPLKLTRNGTSITLTDGLSCQRQVGRPESSLRSRPGDLPNYVDKIRSASDVFDISGTFVSDTARTDATTFIEDILREPLGRSSLTLDFQGLWGLGSYDVFPDGNQAARVSVGAGEGTGSVDVNSLQLRVVNNA